MTPCPLELGGRGRSEAGRAPRWRGSAGAGGGVCEEGTKKGTEAQVPGRRGAAGQPGRVQSGSHPRPCPARLSWRGLLSGCMPWKPPLFVMEAHPGTSPADHETTHRQQRLQRNRG